MSKTALLNRNKPEEQIVSEFDLATMESGILVGKVAQDYFENSVDVTVNKNNKPDLLKMIENTRNEISKGTTAICEASFEYDNLFCSVDILKKRKTAGQYMKLKVQLMIQKLIKS